MQTRLTKITPHIERKYKDLKKKIDRKNIQNNPQYIKDAQTKLGA
jgi:hypothetical protein